MKPYTVILLCPDYATSSYGSDTCCLHVNANSPRAALAEARANIIEGDDNEGAEPADYFCVAVFDGELTNLNPEM